MHYLNFYCFFNQAFFLIKLQNQVIEYYFFQIYSNYEFK
jgi:hypothetical protein